MGKLDFREVLVRLVRRLLARAQLCLRGIQRLLRGPDLRINGRSGRLAKTESALAEQWQEQD